MAQSQVTRVSFFEVHTDGDHTAYYRNHVDVDVEPGAHGDPVAAAVRHGAVPARSRSYHARKGGVLDIDEQMRGGHCLYVFFLSEETKLKFADPPILCHPLNTPAGEPDFLTDPRILDGNGRRWASVACDLDTVRSSPLAGRIKKLPHGHAKALTLPFSLNVIDDELQAAPWVVPALAHVHTSPREDGEERERGAENENGGEHGNGHEHEHEHEHGDAHQLGDKRARAARRRFTHGGVHPPTVSFISVDFEDPAP